MLIKIVYPKNYKPILTNLALANLIIILNTTIKKVITNY